MFCSPTADEVAWARGFAGSDEHLLVMVVLLKCFGRLGYFPPLQTVPAVVIEHVRRDLGLPEDVVAVHAAPRTAKRHRDFVRQRFGVVRNSAAARKVAAEAIQEAAHARNQPPDLINIALERLVEGCFELPAFSTLDKMASRIRGEVNGEIFAGITGRAGPSGVGSLQALLEPKGPRGKTDLDRLKRSAPRPTWTNFRKQLDQLRWVDGIGDAGRWVEPIAATKLADFAGEAEAADAGVLRDYGEAKQVAALAALAHWLEWWRRFGPASGSDPKLADAFFRYVLTAFTYGSNLGPAQAARHMAGVSAHELGATFRRHATLGKVNRASADVVDAFCELDLVRAWGDGAAVAADGTQIDTFIDNLLAETSIRYGGTGGIACHYVSDTYIALFSKFIRAGCGRPST